MWKGGLSRLVMLMIMIHWVQPEATESKTFYHTYKERNDPCEIGLKLVCHFFEMNKSNEIFACNCKLYGFISGDKSCVFKRWSWKKGGYFLSFTNKHMCVSSGEKKERWCHPDKKQNLVEDWHCFWRIDSRLLVRYRLVLVTLYRECAFALFRLLVVFCALVAYLTGRGREGGVCWIKGLALPCLVRGRSFEDLRMYLHSWPVDKTCIISWSYRSNC